MRRNASPFSKRNDLCWTLWWWERCLPGWLRKELFYRLRPWNPVSDLSCQLRDFLVENRKESGVFFCYVNRKNLDYWSKNYRSRDLNGLFVSSILKKVDHSFANITDASFLPGLHLGELAVHEQNILGNGPKVFYAFTDIWISDIIRIIEFIPVDVCRT